MTRTIQPPTSITINSSAWRGYLAHRLAPKHLPLNWLSIDPGETTGWAKWQEHTPIQAGQFHTSLNYLERLIHDSAVSRIVIEDYIIYAHAANQHINSRVPTLRFIGAIELLAFQSQIPITYQLAAQAKQFCDDSKLMRWQLVQRGQPHATDAIRHGCYYVLFGGSQ